MKHIFIISHLWMFGLCLSLGIKEEFGHALVSRAPPNPSTPSGHRSARSRSRSPDDSTASSSRSPSPDRLGKHREPIQTGLSSPLSGLSVDDPLPRFKRPSGSLSLPLGTSGRSSSPSSVHPSLPQHSRASISHGQPSPKRARMGAHNQMQSIGSGSLQQSSSEGQEKTGNPQQLGHQSSGVGHIGPAGQMIHLPASSYLGSWLQGRTPTQQKEISRSLSALVQEAIGQPRQPGAKPASAQRQQQQSLLHADPLSTPFSSLPQQSRRQKQPSYRQTTPTVPHSQLPPQHDTPMPTPQQASIHQPSSSRPEPLDTPMTGAEHQGLSLVQNHLQATHDLVNDHNMATYAHQQQSMQQLAELRHQRNAHSQQFFSDFGSLVGPGQIQFRPNQPQRTGQNREHRPPYPNQNPGSGA